MLMRACKRPLVQLLIVSSALDTPMGYFRLKQFLIFLCTPLIPAYNKYNTDPCLQKIYTTVFWYVYCPNASQCRLRVSQNARYKESAYQSLVVLCAPEASDGPLQDIGPLA